MLLLLLLNTMIWTSLLDHTTIKLLQFMTKANPSISNVANAIIENPVPPAPTNLVATVRKWYSFNLGSVGSGEWIQWDAGVNNGNGIGLTSGGTFSVASHWTPADLTHYNGFSLQKVQFWPNGDPAATYVIKVWSGANGTTVVAYTECYQLYVVDWNEVVLTTPVLIIQQPISGLVILYPWCRNFPCRYR